MGLLSVSSIQSNQVLEIEQSTFSVFPLIIYIFVVALGLPCCMWFSLVAESGATLQLCTGLSLQSVASLVDTGSRGGLGSYGIEAQLLCSTWNLSGPGLRTCASCIGSHMLIHCTIREVPRICFFFTFFPGLCLVSLQSDISTSIGFSLLG